MSLDIEDPAQLENYLRSTNRIGSAEKIEIRTLAGGVSNKTVHVRRESGEAWVLKQALAKLRVKVDWFSDPARVRREALGLQWLAKLAPEGTITPLIFEDPQHHLLAMQAVPQPHENWKTMLLAGRVESAQVRQFGELLGIVHREGWLAREETSRVFEDRSFFESLRVEPYYLYAAQEEQRASAFIHRLVEETRRTRLTIVHGDYSPKNVLVREGRLILLDHEVIHFGEPAFDLGFAMTHLLSKAHHLPAARDRFAEATRAFWRSYRKSLGDVPWSSDLDARAARHTLGCLLARVAGRSPLEYLSEDEKARQREVVVELMRNPPATVSQLIEEFVTRIN